MEAANLAVTESLQSAYNEQYDSDLTEWRRLGAKYKAQNIQDLAGGNVFNRVLDCGAGDGSIMKVLETAANFQNFYAIEISDSGIGQIKKSNFKKLAEVKKFDGYKIPYPDKYFDLVYCSHVIEHVEHPRILLREIKRVSKQYIFEVPLDYYNGMDKNINYFLDYGHINIYTPSLFKFLLKSEGFEIKAEKLTRSSDEIIRYNWYKNQKRNKSFVSEVKIKVRPLFLSLKKLLSGTSKFNENEFSALTCLAQQGKDITIM